jgi:hypothetical protein
MRNPRRSFTASDLPSHTCALLWAARQPERLSGSVRDLLLSREELALSVVSAYVSLRPHILKRP